MGFGEAADALAEVATKLTADREPATNTGTSPQTHAFLTRPIPYPPSGTANSVTARRADSRPSFDDSA